MKKGSGADDVLRVIEGGKGKQPQRPKRPGRPRAQPTLLKCTACRDESGHGTIAMVRVRIAAMYDAGKVTGGSYRWVCAFCLTRGRLTYMT
ncbi:MAG: hypothetical protein HQL38_11585 [Alphaproteobacteria bacterium]|nr:hypothetical protein [Alphaproteobacteria bacterium]MBF0393310.1 hypothetical protein [Alphaproteobacteria bacterium]